jgi:hypothetical protein
MFYGENFGILMEALANHISIDLCVVHERK